MSRQLLQSPQSIQEWDELPQEFIDYLDRVDSIRSKMEEVNLKKVDSLYPDYRYDWEIDSTIPFETILYYWNDVDHDLPDPEKIIEEIDYAMGEADYDAVVSSYYSY